MATNLPGFGNGIADATASSRIEGSGVEEWRVLREKNGDIETFEAATQAWVDTGTLDGLVRSVFFACCAVLALVTFRANIISFCIARIHVYLAES